MEKQDQFTRYSRQIFMEEVGIEGQRKIMKSNVLVVGAGGLGSPVIQYLATAGVGTIAVIDADDVEIHNLQRQVIHSENSLGVPKVHSAAWFVNNINPEVEFVAIHERLNEDNARSILKDYDLILDCSDNFDTRYLINDHCVALQKPVIYGSILSFEGQVAVFNYQGSKQLRDLFPEAPENAFKQDCDRLGVLGPLAGIVGSMMALLALKMMLQLPVATNQLTLIDTLHWQFQTIDF